MTKVLVSKLQVLQKSILRVIVNRCTLNCHICTDIIRSTSQGTFLPLGFSPRLYSVVGTNNNFSFLSFLFCITKSLCKNFSLIGAYKYPLAVNQEGARHEEPQNEEIWKAINTQKQVYSTHNVLIVFEFLTVLHNLFACSHTTG